MEFKEAMRIWKRMCHSIEDSGCSGCPFKEVGDGICRRWAGEHPIQAEKILSKWAAEHPEKTIMDDFFEKLPKALRDDNGYPTTCARRLGYVCECPIAEDKASDCVACWRRPLEEVE